MKIKVVNQRLYLEPPETAEGTREYLRAEFSFSEEWEGTVKTAFFRGADGNTYTQLLENDACTVPAVALAAPGRVGVSVSGTLGETVITTDIKSFSLPATLSGGTPSDPELTLWQEVLDKFEKVSEVEEKVTELKSEIATKITAPENPEVGKAFKIKSVNDDGTFIGEWADCTNLDVQINGESIVTDGIAEIPIANRDNVFGVVKTVPYEFWGTGVGASSNDGQLRLYPASNGNIDARQKINVSPISVNNLDYAVKSAMCDGKGAAWTEEEQAAARERMGAYRRDYRLIADITLEQESSKLIVEKDADGKDISLRKAKIFVFSPAPRENSKNNGYVLLNDTASYYGAIDWKVNEKNSVTVVNIDVFGGIAPATVKFVPAHNPGVAVIKSVSMSVGSKLKYYNEINKILILANHYFDKGTRFIIIGKE